MKDKPMTTKEVAEWFSTTERTIINWTKSGTLKGYRLGRMWRFNQSDFGAAMGDKAVKKEGR